MEWWHYLLLVNIYLVLFYGFYVLLLCKETFFQLNRIYLVSAALLSFFIPLIQSDWVKNLFITQKVQYTIYSSPVVIYQFEPIRETHVTVGQILIFIYLAGAIFFAGKLVWQMIALKRIMSRTQSVGEPYSFFKMIKLRDDQTNRDIIAAHEHAHASQWHSADVLLIEVITIISWFNPVIHLYRLAIKHIHEFIADRQALKSGTDKSAYAILLLNQTFNTPANHLVNSFFNHSLLKQRIMMLQKNKSHRIALIKYGLSVPLFILMLILSSATVNNSKTIKLLSRKANQVLLTPAITGAVNNKVRDAEQANADDSRILHKAIKKRTNVKENVLQPAADTAKSEDNRIFTAVEQAPEFPGGIKAFGEFLARNIRYPSAMRQKSIQGRVIVGFVVERDGSLTDIKVIRGIGYGADDEAVRVINLSPKWQRGTQNGRPVRVRYVVPISFTLSEERVNSTGNQTGAVNENISNPGSSVTAIGLKTDSGRSAQTFTLNGPNKPLVIVDGKEITDIKSIDPNDIVSIDVLKNNNNSATLLYGPRAANGVIIITTKKRPQHLPIKP